MGGVTNNLPVNVVREMGADYVIAVDLFVPLYRPRLGLLGALLSALEMLIRHSGGGGGQADCLIEPALAGHNYLNFSRRKSQEYIALGESATQQVIPAIKSALSLTDEISLAPIKLTANQAVSS